ncbi:MULTISPECIES: hypothetical protein [Streptomyces]|uniref:Uncharacterized protein n=1 Tax=Streptomyces chartreusis NRRL 3882 TaxID=1079985 RepID=A0A2N9B9U1_STRCX|nr:MULTISPECIES: hypothetical protein [Streptomyces]MYS93817.1 hypothetical protein [Streptomyces sp. SID5464]SOR80121.1 hypothetical protein SCNRRL3882_3577 [Streptomyces chartreusis NRRL 3882]
MLGVGHLHLCESISETLGQVRTHNAVMTPGQRTAAWSCAILFGLTLLGLGAYFLIVGLDEADKTASVVGSLTGLAGLGVSIVSLIQARGSSASRNAPSVRQSQQSGTRSTNIQSAGDLTIGDMNRLGGEK